MAPFTRRSTTTTPQIVWIPSWQPYYLLTTTFPKGGNNWGYKERLIRRQPNPDSDYSVKIFRYLVKYVVLQQDGPPILYVFNNLWGDIEGPWLSAFNKDRSSSLPPPHFWTRASFVLWEKNWFFCTCATQNTLIHQNDNFAWLVLL